MAEMTNYEDLFEPVRAFIQRQLVEDVLPSLAVAVAHRGEIVWEEGFGWADREKRIKATPHTMYSLASISKPITATGLMILRERGLLEIDRPINDYLGEARLVSRVGDVGEATVRRVTNHTSGLPLHYHFFPADETDRRPPMDETIRRYANLVTKPGERYQYSNLGYGILDHVIARLSNSSFADFMHREVFLPLGMFHSSVDVAPELEPYAAARYRGGNIRLPCYDFDHPGGSAIFASAHDLIRFALFHLKTRLPDQKPILPDAALDEMHRPTAVVHREDGSSAGYAVGWAVREGPNSLVISHEGSMDGVRTVLQLIPSEQLAVVALTNASSDLPRQVVREIYKVMLSGYAEKPSQERPMPDEPSKFVAPVELRGVWQGSVHTYQGDLSLTLDFKEGCDVHARLGNQLWTLLNDAQLNDGWLTGRMAGDIGTADANRRPYLLHADLRLRGDVLNGALIAKSPPETRLGHALSHWVELRRAG